MMRNIDNDLLKKEVAVLCVEDELIIMESLRIVLKRRFERTYMALNGKIGLDLFNEHKVDIVITDIMMPVMDGIEMVKRILESKPYTPIIILSALNDEPYLIKAKELGIKYYITKPFSDEDFFSVIYEAAREVLENRDNPTV
ncbi:MAG: response regulator [Nitrospirae bacterium]|nr:response regulator [Nitrospirota bacterium]